MKKVLFIALFATVLSVSAHVPDSLINIVQDHLFNDGYFSINIDNGDQAPYVYSTNPSMTNADTVFYVKEPGTYIVFMKSIYNPSTQYQINVIVEERPAIVKDVNGKAYVFDGKILKYRGLKTKLKPCE